MNTATFNHSLSAVGGKGQMSIWCHVTSRHGDVGGTF